MGNKNQKETMEILLTTMPSIKDEGTTTTMVESKTSVPPIDHHLMVIKLGKANNINLFIKIALQLQNPLFDAKTQPHMNAN